MNLILNLLWLVLGGGLLIALEYALAGALLCVTVVGIPFGLQCFKMAGLGLWPFGRAFAVPPTGGAVRLVFNVLWFLFAGVWIFLSHIALAVAEFDGVPSFLQQMKIPFRMGSNPARRQIFFRDPDGNKLVVHKRKK